MSGKFQLIVLGLFLIIQPMLATEKETVNTKTNIVKFDTNYIKSYCDWFHLTVVGAQKQSVISLTNVKADNNLNFSSNNPMDFGLAFDYEWFTFEYTHSFNSFNFVDSKKGISENSSLQFGLTGRKFRITTYYRFTTGFYIDNIEDFSPNYFQTHQNYPYYPNINNFIFDFSLYYTFNHKKFSNTAALWQIDRQLKSAGSPVLGFITNLESIDFAVPLTLADTSLTSNIYPDFKDAAYVRVGLTGGYMHTFAIKKRFYIHGALIQGFMYNAGNQLYFDDREETYSQSLAVSIFLRLTAGYNGDKWYGGIFYEADAFMSDALADMSEITNYNYFRIYVGYRFHINKRPWMKKLYL